MKSESRKFKAQKKFGQHFLIDQAVVDSIIEAAQITKEEHLLEIGPGPGILTKALISSPAQKITSIEIDSQFWASLEALESARFCLLKKDALQVSIKGEFKEKVKIIANLPYNIGNKLLINWMDELEHIQSMTLMLQDEVVERICAKPSSKAYGRLSILLQWLCDVRPLFTVPPGAFRPAPKVMSAVVQIIPRQTPLYKTSKQNLEKLTQLVFHQRRKMIGTSLKKINHQDINAVFKSVGVNAQMRPEEISVLQFCQLSDLLKDHL